MKNSLIIIATMLMFLSCRDEKKVESDKLNIEGNWLLLNSVVIENADTVYSDYTKGRKAIKMLNSDYFAFFQHDIDNEDDSLKVFVSGAGAYKLEGNLYTEYLEYCNYREYENNTFQFEVSIKNDTLIQRGKEELESLGEKRYIIETYKRIK